jgi:hypothetical protein
VGARLVLATVLILGAVALIFRDERRGDAAPARPREEPALDERAAA